MTPTDLAANPDEFFATAINQLQGFIAHSQEVIAAIEGLLATIRRHSDLVRGVR